MAVLLDSTPSDDGALPCRRDPDLWFAETPRELERAKVLCSACPVKEQCLAGALSRGEPWGVWGGEILDRGSVITRKRPRGRPPKNTSANEAGTGTARRDREQVA
nr:WhiB family transcriptional regulator [Halopolyspora algeriensis]